MIYIIDCILSMQGGDKLQEAFYIYQELSEKFSATAQLLNGKVMRHDQKVVLMNSKATAFIQQGKYIDAEEALLSALEKDTDNAETLINLIAVSTYLAKAPEVTHCTG